MCLIVLAVKSVRYFKLMCPKIYVACFLFTGNGNLFVLVERGDGKQSPKQARKLKALRSERKKSKKKNDQITTGKIK